MSTVAAIHQRGTRGSQPAATAVSIGTIYCVTDEANILERSNGTTWQSYSATGAGSGTVINDATLTSGKTIIGNGTVHVTVSSLTAQFVGSSSGTEAAASMSTARLLGRTTASSGAVEEITVGTGLTLSGGSLVNSGTSGLNLVEQHTASSSSSLDFTTGITSLYDDYEFRLVGIIPATDNTNFTMLVSTDGGMNWLGGTTYSYGFYYWSPNGASGVAATSTGAASLILYDGLSNATTTAETSGDIQLHNPLSSTRRKSVIVRMNGQNGSAGSYALKTAGATLLTTSAINAVRFIMASGAIAEGVIRLYGYAK